MYDFRAEYGNDIDQKLRKLEKENGMNSLFPESENTSEITHLNRHKITEIARARMVDWMFEVIHAFKMSEQTFFLSVQYMDRFISKSKRLLNID